MRWFLAIIAVALVSVPACSDHRKLPEDPQLEIFIRTMARCAKVERSFSANPDLLGREMAGVDLPAHWQELVDSLITRYDGDPDFWQAVYQDILERSRLPAQEP
jgi:hypothetical protein